LNAGGEVAARLEEVQRRIEAAARRAGRAGEEVAVVAVTKGVGPDRVAEALAAGVTRLGESRAQELLEKAEAIEAPEWHFVGRLQRNKVGSLSSLVTLWHSVDRPELAPLLARRAPGTRVLVEVNVTGDPAKGGCSPESAPALAEALVSEGLQVEGLMTVPTLGTDPRPAFAALRSLAERLGLAQLSMGMSDDFEVAVEEGATMVRLGRVLFGPRPESPGLQR
jgi:pyridoxal phosphate enzyme (YggS family)